MKTSKILGIFKEITFANETFMYQRTQRGMKINMNVPSGLNRQTI